MISFYIEFSELRGKKLNQYLVIYKDFSKIFNIKNNEVEGFYCKFCFSGLVSFEGGCEEQTCCK